MPKIKSRITSVQSKTSGFSLVELLISISIAAIILVGMAQAVVIAVDTTERGRRATEAANLAEEGIEALRAMRDDSWSSNIQPLANGASYYPVISGDSWTITASDPGLIAGRYTRKVELSEVYRDADDDISASGSLDPKSRGVTVTVEWLEGDDTASLILETYITNFLNN